MDANSLGGMPEVRSLLAFAEEIVGTEPCTWETCTLFQDPRRNRVTRAQRARQRGRSRKQRRRERALMDGKISDRAIAAENLAQIDKPRKPPPTTFIARQRDTCHDCHRPIEPGERCHYRPDVGIVHHRHDRTEQIGEVCDRCWLVKPCDCE